jgi:hypothetical protein
MLKSSLIILFWLVIMWVISLIMNIWLNCDILYSKCLTKWLNDTFGIDYAIFLVCLDMEEDIGRGRHGRESRTHSSARRISVPVPRRGRQGKRRMEEEQGGRGSHATESSSRRPRHEDYDASLYINEDAQWAQTEVEEEQEQAQAQAQAEAQQARNEAGEPSEPPQGFGGGPSDLSVLTGYEKHRSIPIWEAEPGDFEVKI